MTKQKGGKKFYQKTTLPSGLRVLTEAIPHVRSVCLGFWMGVGARDEEEELGGISHFLEHLIFKGTKTRSAREISELFDTLGGELNAFTAKEYTTYFARLLDEHVPVGVEVLADMLQNSAFRVADMNSERDVVLEEINLHEDSPDERIHDLFATSLWGHHPLGKSILGQADTVRSMSGSEIRDFFDKAYVPANMVVAAAGHLEHEAIVDLVDKHFVPRPGGPHGRKLLPAHPEAHATVFSKKTEQAHISYGTQAVSAKDPRRFALAILDNILGGGMSSRLFQEIREKRGLAYAVYSYHSLYADGGLFSVYAGTNPAKAEEVVKLVQAELDKMAKKGVTDEEVYRAKEHFKGQLVLGMESTSNRMTRLGKSELGDIEILSLDQLVERIDSVTAEAVLDVARTLFSPDRMVLTVIGPFEVDAMAHLVA